MATGGTSTDVAEANPSQLLPHDSRELARASKYAAENEEKIKGLSDDIEVMGKLRLLWDSKVPEKSKRFYYFFKLSVSNREEVLSDIQKYMEFYNEMTSVVTKVGNVEERSAEEHPYTIVLDLSEKLRKLHEAANTGEKCTSSSVVCNLHRNFIKNHEKLENMIKRVECIALKEDLRKATSGWQESLQGIGTLTTELRNAEQKYDRMCDRLDRLMIQNDDLLGQQRALLENDRRREQQLEAVLQENTRMQYQQEILSQEKEAIMGVVKSYVDSMTVKNGEI